MVRESARPRESSNILGLIVAVLLVVPGHTPPGSSSWWDDWQGRVDVHGGLTVELLVEARRHLPDRGDVQIVAVPSKRSHHISIGVEQWRPVVAEWWPPEVVPAALTVMQCESGGDPTAKNTHSTAAGLFQFLRGTWNRVAPDLGSYESGAVYDPYKNIEAAHRLWAETRTWAAWSCKP